MAWIGASFYFNWLENNLDRKAPQEPGISGNLWAIHGGGFYHLRKFKTAPAHLPPRARPRGATSLLALGFALPLGAARFLVLVSAAVPPLRASDLSLFITDGRQGVNLRRGVWHHFRIALESTHDFIVIDRAGNGNSEQTEVADEVWIREV